ncbi:MAG: response regulator [Oligoflexales bacterium]|nr:response regulator [Oligoflexales bacterium]
MAPVVLVVDDSKTVRMTMSKMLRDLGLAAAEASTGDEGLRLLRENPQVKLVLADYNMPDLNGIEMVKRIKSDQDLKHIHCVMVTSIGVEADRLLEIAKDAGVIAWLTKPVNRRQLKSLALKLGVS